MNGEPLSRTNTLQLNADTRRGKSALCNFSVSSFHYWSPFQGLGRSMIAVAQISILLFTSASRLSPDSVLTEENRCEAIKSANAYCLMEGNEQLVSYLFAGLLFIIIIGFFPFVISVIHLYITFCLTDFITVPDGGDFVAIPAVIALLFLSMADNRRNHWHPVQPPSSPLGVRIGIGLATAWGIRFQVAYIYLNAAVAKLFPEEWQTGSAFYYITKSEMFGVSGWLIKPVDFIVGFPIVTLTFTWGTILFEFLLALAIAVGSVKIRRVALICSIIFHLFIALFIGIFSFALIMIGVVILANSDVYSIRFKIWKTFHSLRRPAI